jgi:hypothetical protein
MVANDRRLLRAWQARTILEEVTHRLPTAAFAFLNG